MSCSGCRVLRKACGQNCLIKPCLDWIPTPQSQANATLFLSKFFGRTDLISFISSVPNAPQRTALFQSLLYEAVGRTVNPVNGAMGLLSTGNWHICEAGVQTVLAGGVPLPVVDGNLVPEVDESSEGFQAKGELAMKMIRDQTGPGNSDALPPTYVTVSNRNFSIVPASDVEKEVPVIFRRGNGEEPKLLNLF